MHFESHDRMKREKNVWKATNERNETKRKKNVLSCYIIKRILSFPFSPFSYFTSYSLLLFEEKTKTSAIE